MKQQLQHLYEGGQFSTSEAKELMLRLTNGEFSPEEVAAFLMALNMRNLVVDELIGFREAMLQQALQIDLSDYNTVDIVGTGGDGKNTFNISTCTAFVVAGAGYKVAKHGSYAVSSVSGSADVLAELGIKFTNNETTIRQALEEANISFLHAPMFHPAMKHVVPIRKALGIKTIFNLLGPLINPSNSSYAVIGVYSDSLAPIFSDVLSNSDLKNYQIVHALDGYDEISLTGNTLIVNRNGENIMSPEDFYHQKINPSSIFGGSTVQDAAKMFLSILDNQSTVEQREVVLANAALAIVTIDPNLSLIDAKQQALEAIESGSAKTNLDRLVSITNQ